MKQKCSEFESAAHVNIFISYRSEILMKLHFFKNDSTYNLAHQVEL